LYVVNLGFLTGMSARQVRAISEQLRQMGESILLAAQAQADSKSVGAEATVRLGEVGEEIAHLCRELRADYLVLGQPGGVGEEDVFTQDQLAQLWQCVENETGASVVLSQVSGE
jgi:nucleotide-binding universal stress UspA family protein